MSEKETQGQAPARLTGLKLTKPKQMAGGFPAIFSSMKHVFGEVGLVNGTKAMLKVNQFHGFDCPGCAWPDPDEERAIVEFCENGAKAVSEEATTARVDPTFFKNHSINELSDWSDYQLGKSGRITHPMILRKGSANYEPISWNDAFDYIGKKLNQLNSPDEAIFYTSGRTSNEAAFLYQLFVRQYGTNNLPDCSNMCHESSGTGLSQTVGIGKGSVTLDDFYKAEVIVIMGQNPGTNHPRMLIALQKAKENGAKIITINPLSEAGLLKFKHPQRPQDLLGSGTALTDLLLQVRVNGDVPLLKAICKKLLIKEEEIGGVLDHEFIASNTSGVEDFLKDLQQYDLQELINQTSVTESKIDEAVELIANKEKIIVCWAMGLTQHKNAVDNIREVVNLLLLKGSIGKPGAGTCPVRGHSNVQGDRTVGIWEKLKPEFGQKLKEVFSFEPPAKTGYDVVESIRAMGEGRAKVFFAMGGNFLSATPDTEYTAKALRNCQLTVQVSTKLNRSHLVHGEEAIILPCLGRTERDIQNGKQQFVTVENSTGVVHQSTGGRKPASEYLLSEPRIVAELAKATLGNRSKTNWDELANDYDRIRDVIEKTIPGFDNYNQRVRRPGGFYLPNGAREGVFHTDTGKANFTINQLPDHQLGKDDFLMMTIRSHDQYNTTIYGLDDRYRGIGHERRVVLMNAQDIADANLKEKQLVHLVSNYDGIQRKAENFVIVTYDIPQRCLGTYFPEANAVIPHNYFARESQTPISKSVIVKLEPAQV